MSKKRLIIIGAIIVALIASYSLFGNSNDENSPITTQVIKGQFLNEVIISGEAQSTSSKKIMGPTGARRYQIYQLKIQDLIPEGTIVKKGDYVGKLDPSEINAKILDAQLNLENAQSKYIQEQLDTTLTLKQERNTVKDLQFKIEEDKLELERSIYEPPATIRSLEISVEKTERNLKEKKADYSIKKRQADAKMIEVGTEVSKIKKQIEALTELQNQFTIRSHDDGMVTYIKDWNGNKIKVGASVSTWEPAIASLPDLTKMESKTYSNEVDIRKIKKDLPVKVGFDAFPDIELDGVVTDVANVGENKKGSDIKLFQVLIKLNNTNENIRPGMTTSNRILTHTENDVLMIPLEAVFTKDSITFAYVKSGYSIQKRQIELGLSNNEVVIIKKGLEENETVYLNKPEDQEDKSITLLK
ncbi:efflux RND transporter periplasmic adaptor subunit [Jejuia pallidilutea]|jgi:multidrug efflux pump subunit AcrA (membrane-fusion protein)|uniref:Possible membrane fusion protein n=1 Tax=Jejuia pallidilutea TaxID=504487 RepID=A0A090VV70_9FLAO|nr:HlyD family efflux transporter periplasmic adaptor subunit [Jejuia pallidilutea]GAL68640.1 possible membrane fusion protein [Jejuia pallidilutea]GAL89279.1 possible membrane fusion protein [Jejuia pallidilutea]